MAKQVIAFVIGALLPLAAGAAEVLVTWPDYKPTIRMSDGTPVPATLTLVYDLYSSVDAKDPKVVAAGLTTTSSSRGVTALGNLCYWYIVRVQDKPDTPVISTEPSPQKCVVLTSDAKIVLGLPAAPSVVKK